MIDVFTFVAFLVIVLGPPLVASFYGVKTKANQL